MIRKIEFHHSLRKILFSNLFLEQELVFAKSKQHGAEREKFLGVWSSLAMGGCEGEEGVAGCWWGGCGAGCF